MPSHDQNLISNLNKARYIVIAQYWFGQQQSLASIWMVETTQELNRTGIQLDKQSKYSTNEIGTTSIYTTEQLLMI